MQAAMDRLDGFTRRHGRLVAAAWLVLLLAALPFAARQTEHLTSGGFEVPGSGSAAVERGLTAFEGAQRSQLAVVIARRPGSSAQDVQQAIDQVRRGADKTAHVSLTASAAAAAAARSDRAPITVVPLKLSGTQDDAANAAADLRRELDLSGKASGKQPVELHLVGQQALWAGMQDLAKHDLQAAEQVGFPIVLLILLAVFGSLAAAALPLALGAASVAITGAAIFFLSQATQMSVFVTNIASMIGIGVAVDYSLFVLARYREEIAAGASREDARRTAMRTSGIAVAFSGVTVMLALAGLFLIDTATIRSMAMGAIIVVAVSVLAATTLLPVLMSMFGRRAYARGRVAIVGGLIFRGLRNMRRRAGSTHPSRHREPFWERWAQRVMRHPVIAVVLSASVLLALAVPALSLKFGDGALRQFPKDNETRVGAELAAKATGPGASGPTQVLVSFDRGTVDRTALDRYTASLRGDPEAASVGKPRVSGSGSAVLIAITPRHDPESPQARALVSRLRAEAGAVPEASIHVGGSTAQVEDFKDLVSGSMWKILLFVLAFSYLVLLVLLRSVLLPLKAVLVNLLSVAAAYGVLVAVFQWGWFDGLLGFHHLGYVNTLTPPFLLAIVFGLSMDYEVFLLTRVRERYDATGDTRRAVGEGLAGSARTISSAALIMVAVFSVFAFTGVPSVKEIGVGLAVAIALDATLVRLVLVPAVMELMGRWNWWLPAPLARVLPRAEFEGRAEPAKA
ncbi:MAG: putative drug exporter of the superfamily [Thermoleophilaceae bacterium]|nr:putative drug exporter of the superfamily [Thermoleophilaceae bacterium]